jgi:hypothetical protein
VARRWGACCAALPPSPRRPPPTATASWKAERPTPPPSVSPGCPLATTLSAIGRQGWGFISGASGSLKQITIVGMNGNPAAGYFSGDLQCPLILQRSGYEPAFAAPAIVGVRHANRHLTFSSNLQLGHVHSSLGPLQRLRRFHAKQDLPPWARRTDDHADDQHPESSCRIGWGEWRIVGAVHHPEAHRITNKTRIAATFSLWLGATGANTAGTEVIGQAQSVAANSSYDWYGLLRLDAADFLVGGSGTTTALSISGEGEIGVSG